MSEKIGVAIAVAISPEKGFDEISSAKGFEVIFEGEDTKMYVPIIVENVTKEGLEDYIKRFTENIIDGLNNYEAHKYKADYGEYWSSVYNTLGSVKDFMDDDKKED